MSKRSELCLHDFRLDDKHSWNKDIPVAVYCISIQFIYDFVDFFKKKERRKKEKERKKYDVLSREMKNITSPFGYWTGPLLGLFNPLDLTVHTWVVPLAKPTLKPQILYFTKLRAPSPRFHLFFNNEARQVCSFYTFYMYCFRIILLF